MCLFFQRAKRLPLVATGVAAIVTSSQREARAVAVTTRGVAVATAIGVAETAFLAAALAAETLAGTLNMTFLAPGMAVATVRRTMVKSSSAIIAASGGGCCSIGAETAVAVAAADTRIAAKSASVAARPIAAWAVRGRACT